MALAGVLFDMDGLLIDTEPLWMRAEQDLVAELGGTWTVADQQAILGLALPLSSQYIKQRSGTSLPAEQVGADLIARFLAYLGNSELTIQPGAVELVSDVARAGLPFALVSASTRAIMELVTAGLARAGMPPFPVTVAGDEVGNGKPNPEPYLTAARLLGVNPRDCVVLEDSGNGVAAGEASGAAVIALTHMVDHQPRGRVTVRDTLVGLDVVALQALIG